MYYYTLFKKSSAPEGLTVVKAEVDIETLDALQAAVKEDIGFIPDWLLDCSKDQYLQEEDWQGEFMVDIEGAEVD